MSIIIDLIIVGILALCIFLGIKKGLTGSILKVFSFIIAVVISIVLFRPVSNFVIEKTLIDDKIEESLVSIVEKDVDEEGQVKEDSNLPKSLVDNINESLKNATEDAKSTIVKSTAHNITITIVSVGVAIVLFVVTRILLIFVKMFVKFLTDLPIIKQFDKAGGFIYGVLEGLLIVYVLLGIISCISPLIEETGLLVGINKSYIGSLLYNNNILLNIIL